MALSLQFVFPLIVSLYPCFAGLEVSKACYGSPGQSCTTHILSCSSGNISIAEAFYIEATACPLSGVPDCAQIDVNSITLTGKRYNFSDAELDSLYEKCCTQSECSLTTTRTMRGYVTFSAIIYKCINGQCSTPPSEDTENDEENAGAIAGGVIGVLFVCAAVAAVIIWFKFVRNKKKDENIERRSDNYAFADSLSSTAVEHRGSRKTTSNYDYATIHKGDNPVGRVQNHYVLGKPSTENGTTVFMEDDYNHINHSPPQGASSPGYDTTASATAAVKKLKNVSSNSIEDDDYNHLGEGKPSVVSSDYDTTVSASKAVVHLGEMKDSEDDYDHFKRSEDRVIDSP